MRNAAGTWTALGRRDFEGKRQRVHLPPSVGLVLEVNRLAALGTQLYNFALRGFEGLFDVVLTGDTALAGRKLMGKDAELNRYSDELQDLLVVLAVVLAFGPVLDCM